MRDRLIRAIWFVATVLTVALSRPLTGRPPQKMRWTVGAGPRKGWIVFTPTRSWATRYHVWAVLEDDGDLWVFDPNSDQWGVALMRGLTESTLPTLLRRLHAEHVVEVRGELPDRTFVAAPVSCVTLVKSALGVLAPSAHTPEQLLQHLWRTRRVGKDQEGS